jgi:hypothetical protein
MTRTISTKTHGAIDYAWGTIAATLPQRMNGASATGRLLRDVSMAASINGSLTNYEAGVIRMMPMRAHLACDLVIGGVLLMAPLLLPRAERRWAAIPIALGLAAIAASLMTETHSPLEGTTPNQIPQRVDAWLSEP